MKAKHDAENKTEENSIKIHWWKCRHIYIINLFVPIYTFTQFTDNCQVSSYGFEICLHLLSILLTAAGLKILWLNSDRDCQLLSCGSKAYQRNKPTNPRISFLSQCSIFWPESRNPSGNNYESHWSILSFAAFHLKRNLLWEPNSFISSHSIKHLHKIIRYFLNVLKATRKQYLIWLFS